MNRLIGKGALDYSNVFQSIAFRIQSTFWVFKVHSKRL